MYLFWKRKLIDPKEIEKRMVEFWETICPLFPIDTYAIDFAVLPEKVWL